MKYLTITFLSVLILYACSNNSSINEKELELELKEKELELKEKELKLEQRRNSNENDSNHNQSTANNGNNYSQSSRQKSADDLREELYIKEKKNPKDYLSVTFDLNYRVLSGKDEIRGTIYNYATMATFKDVELTVTYSTNTNTELSRETFIVYDYVYPGSSTSFNIKTYSPEGTKKIGVSIKSAIGE